MTIVEHKEQCKSSYEESGLMAENDRLRDEVALLEKEIRKLNAENMEIKKRDAESLVLLEEARQMILETTTSWGRMGRRYEH